MTVLPQVTGRYRTPNGDAVEIVVADERGTLVDAEIIHAGQVVDYLEDVTPWYVDELARQRGWTKVAR